MFRWIVLLTLGVTLTACRGRTVEDSDDADVPEEPDTCFASTTAALLGGADADASDRARAVGRLRTVHGECTATLIAEDVAITAAHCLAFKTCEEPACQLSGQLDVDGRSAPVIAVASYLGRLVRGAAVDTYRADVALVRLGERLSAPTLTLAPRWPAPGEALEHFGFGCLSRCEPSAPPTLQRVETIYGAPSSVVCAGDSGGPVLDARGRVLRIASGFRTKTGDDFFGDVVSLAPAIDATLSAWREAPPSRPALDCAGATSCGDCASQRDCGYCAATGACLEGSVFGAFAEDACPTEQWLWNARSCDGAEPLPDVTRVPVGDCAAAATCVECARLPSCGWSETHERCVRGSASGPREPDVDALGWVFMGACCPASSESRCGDGVCDPGETCATCDEDCGGCPPRCGDGVCDALEDCATCAEDCVALCNECAPRCGDGHCDRSESCASCAEDCGRCDGACGDGICDAGERCDVCPSDCGACPSACGDGRCDADESCERCAEDCGSCAGCGDGLCEPRNAEACDVCPADCGACPTGAPIVHIDWTQEDEVMRFVMVVPEAAVRAELRIDGAVLGTPQRRLGDAPVLVVNTQLFTKSEGRVLTALAYDAADALVATGDALLDVTDGAGVWMRRRADRTFDIGLERASAGVFSFEVDADDFPVRDTISDDVRSSRGWVRGTFTRSGTRSIAIRTYGRDGALRGVLRRTLVVP